VHHVANKWLSILQRLFIGSDAQSNDVPLADLRHARSHSATHQDAIDEETERHLCVTFLKSYIRACI